MTAKSLPTNACRLQAEEPVEEPVEEPAAPAVPAGGSGGEGCSEGALEIIKLLNAYRAENGLPSIPSSKSLCKVGAAHVAESATMTSPNQSGQCNMHSWKDCCYTEDHGNMACMQAKPAEMTCYAGKGYENSAWQTPSISPAGAMEMWKGSPGHNSVMINLGSWANQEWKAVGAGINEEFAHLWFGAEADDC